MPENCQSGELVEAEFELRQARLVNESVTEAKEHVYIDNQYQAADLQMRKRFGNIDP